MKKIATYIYSSILVLILAFMFIPVIGINESHSDGGEIVSKTYFYSVFQIMIKTTGKGFLNGLFFVSGIVLIVSLIVAIMMTILDKKILSYIFIGLAGAALLVFIPLIYPIIFVIIIFLILILTLISKIVVDRRIKQNGI